PKTHWHTSFTPKPLAHPHELVIDLGKRYEVRGIRYLARQDGGWNGAIGKCEFTVSMSSDKFDGPATKATFQKTKQAQEAQCEPVKGRFIRIRVLSEVNGGPWASISELGIVGQP
ncbi:MAG: discoidin domain-containing protein, partial [Fuerstiella sp.]|nr:discoidin domain-containing protein [Fuerstiella sp.]